MDISFTLNKVHCLDVFEALNKMPDECVQMAVTSPPYYRQRNYEMDGQIGNEPTVEEYVDKLCDVFDVVKRVLKTDGVFFLNLGDTFVNKEIMGVPWRVALMMQRRGWHLRTDIIWEKADPMPEPVKVKRPTRAHEYIFMFSKDDKYYYDWEAIAEDIENPGSPRRFSKPGNKDRHDQERIYDPSQYTKKNKRSVWNIPVGKSEVTEHYACVDQETECLTSEGWKKYNEIKKGMLLAQYDVKTQRASWGICKKVFSYEVCDQEMIYPKNRNIQMLLTPNHRTVIFKRSSGYDRKWKTKPMIISANELRPGHGIPISAKWDYKGIEPYSIYWAELMGWYVAEGHENHNSPWFVEIYQSRAVNLKKAERIKWLLKKVGADFDDVHISRIYHGRDATMSAFQVRGFASIFLRQHLPQKKIPHDILLWSDRLLKSFLKGIVGGDGSIRYDDGRISFVQNDIYTLNMVQAIAFRLGYAVKMSRRKKRTKTQNIYFTKKKFISLRGTNGSIKEIDKELYSGIIWCPHTITGTWVARRNGRVFITGNSFPDIIPENCIKAASREGDIVLDPFMGSGTTGVVALRLRRQFLGFDLNPNYCRIANERIDAAKHGMHLQQYRMGQKNIPGLPLVGE